MKKSLFLLVFMGLNLGSFAQSGNTGLLPGAEVLFKSSKSKLTIPEKNMMFKKLNFTLSKDKKKFMSDDMEVDVQSFITDLNKDGTEEVFIVMRSSALFGNTGESFMLYTKNSKGSYEVQPETMGGIAMILNTKNAGYPDIAIGGPGLTFPSYRWDGKIYKQYKSISDADIQNGKVKFKDLEAVSKEYAGN